MQYVTPEYKESMRQPLRNRGYIRVVFGGTNSQAQNSAVISGDQLSYSDPSQVFNNGLDDYVYATLENNFTKVDGSMLFYSPSNILEKAFISDVLIDDEPYTFTISFGSIPVNFDSISFIFGDNYPLTFTINGTSYENTTGRLFTIEETFTDVTELEITITEMLNHNSRFRLYSIRFNSGFEYQNDMILDSELESSISPIGENLPQMSFNVKLVNENHYFDTDNPKSILYQFNSSTEVNVYYGYQLTNSIEWLKAAKLFVESWDSDKESATIYARDILQTLDKDYTSADYNSITLYNLAVAVFAAMGITDYEIDSALSNITTKNALANVTCKEALQIIANAGCKKLFIKRDGSIRIGDELFGYSFSCNGALFSDVSSIGSNDTKYPYAALEKNFTKVDGSMYFYSTTFLNTGYVSTQISNGRGLFRSITGDVNLSEETLRNDIINLPYNLADSYVDSENPVITITLDEVNEIRGLRIIFGGTYAKRFVITTLLDNVVQDQITITNYQTELNVDFSSYCNQIKIEFVETANPYNRVHVNYIEVLQSYSIKFEDIDIMTYPTFTKFETVKRIEVPYYTYTQTNGEWKATETVVYEDINEQGKVIKWENPLITTQTMAQNLLAWLKEYYLCDGVYEFETRGDPEIDVNDNATQKKYTGEDMEVLITNLTLGFNGAFSGSVKTLKKGGA